MDIKNVKQLAAVMKEYELTQLNVKDGALEIGMCRMPPAGAMGMADGPTAIFAVPEAPPSPQPAPAETPAPEAVGEALCAPLVGVAYMAAKPGAAPFVSVGQTVKQGQTLCILEAMKVMNEFPAPRDGVITAICVENEDLVEFGQCLFRLQ